MKSQKLEDNLGFIKNIAKKVMVTTNYRDMEELFQTGCVAYLEAQKHYKPNKGASLLTFSYMYVFGYMMNFARHKSFTDRTHKAEPPIYSLDYEYDRQNSNDNKKFSMQTLLKTETFEDTATLRVLISELPTVQKSIICYKYYFGLKQREIGKLLGFTQTKVSRLENKALQALRRCYNG